MNSRPPIALTIAGNDSSGGAGIQADLKTFSALGCYGVTVLTALPIQNTCGVKSIYSLPVQCVKEQLQAVLEDISIDAIKIGMLHLPEIVEAVAEALENYSSSIVLDPVMVAKDGNWLMAPNTIEVVKKKLFPLKPILTPNLFEASLLLGREILTKNDMEQAAIELRDLGPKAVVVKGGHLTDASCDDCLCVGPNTIHWFSSARIPTKNTHGTGCTFSSAITAFLAKGQPILESIDQAKKYISQCIVEGQHFQIGHGKGPVHHFHTHQQKGVF